MIPSESSGLQPGSYPVSGVSAPRDRPRDEAFATYVLPEIDVLLRVAHSLVPRPADAEDLVQDTLVRAFRSIEGFDGRHPRAWLLTIMRNTQLNRTRRQRPELLDDPDAADAMGTAGEGPSPEALVLGEMFDTAVIDALSALPARSRQIVELVDVNGLSYAEAAEVAGVPVGTVMSRLHRARAGIRRHLADAHVVPRGEAR